jgi:MerR family transcriptional regulator, mercuric resistance operon regulatory protein
MTIRQLADEAGIPTSTIRYYERIRLVEPGGRSQGNYRLYRDESLRRVKFIRAAQAIGFTLDDVKALLAHDARRAPTCASVQSLIEDRLADIEQRLKDLRHVRRVLIAALKNCQKQKKTDCCHVVESLRR